MLQTETTIITYKMNIYIVKIRNKNSAKAGLWWAFVSSSKKSPGPCNISMLYMHVRLRKPWVPQQEFCNGILSMNSLVNIQDIYTYQNKNSPKKNLWMIVLIRTFASCINKRKEGPSSIFYRSGLFCLCMGQKLEVWKTRIHRGD